MSSKNNLYSFDIFHFVLVTIAFYTGMDAQEHKWCEDVWWVIFLLGKDIQDMDLTQALQSLMALFVVQINNFAADITNIIKSKVSEWMHSQALFIQALFNNIS